jgi:hypothetical protein
MIERGRHLRVSGNAPKHRYSLRAAIVECLEQRLSAAQARERQLAQATTSAENLPNDWRTIMAHPAGRRRGHQCDRERITAQHQEGDQPPDLLSLSPPTPINSAGVARWRCLALGDRCPDLDATALHLEVGKRFCGLPALDDEGSALPRMSLGRVRLDHRSLRKAHAEPLITQQQLPATGAPVCWSNSR